MSWRSRLAAAALVALAAISCSRTATSPEGQATFDEASPPVLTILSPGDFAVGRPTLNVVATCTAAGGQRCDLYAHVNNVFIGTGVGSLSLTYDFTTASTLMITAADQSGGVTRKYRTIYQASQNGLGWIADAPGRAVDYDGQRVLYEQTGDRTTIGYTCCPRAGIFSIESQDTASFALPRGVPTPGYLWGGKAFVWASDDGTSAHLYQFDGSTASILRTDVTSLQVSGRYAFLRTAAGEYLRDFETGAEMPSPLGPDDFDPFVVANGDLLFWRLTTPYGVHRWRAGQIGQLSTYHGDRKPVGDGTSVVFQRPLGVIALVDGTNYYQALGTPRYDVKTPLDDYIANEGYVAFTRMNDVGIPQLWTRSPAGALRQRASMTGRATIEGINATGGVVFKVKESLTTRRYYLAPDQTLTNLTPDGRIVWRDHQLVLLLGRTVFRVLPGTPSG